MQTLSINLSPGETVFAQTHGMAWMTDAIEMDTHTGGGMFAGFKRALGGGNFFITDYSSPRGSGPRGSGEVAFAPRFPGQILAMTLSPGQSFVIGNRSLPLLAAAF